MLGLPEIRVALENILCDAARFFQDFHVAQLGDFEVGQARLPRSEKFAGSAQFQIFFCQLETILR